MQGILYSLKEYSIILTGLCLFASEMLCNQKKRKTTPKEERQRLKLLRMKILIFRSRI